MLLKNQYGKVALDMKSVKAQDDVLVIKGDALGSIPVTIHMTAADMWEARQYLTRSVITTVVKLFFRGRKESKRAASAAKKEANT